MIQYRGGSVRDSDLPQNPVLFGERVHGKGDGAFGSENAAEAVGEQLPLWG